MLRTIVIPVQDSIQILLPENYIGKKVEITCIALDELNDVKPVTLGDLFGTMNDADYTLLKQHTENAREEWDRDI